MKLQFEEKHMKSSLLFEERKDIIRRVQKGNEKIIQVQYSYIYLIPQFNFNLLNQNYFLKYKEIIRVQNVGVEHISRGFIKKLKIIYSSLIISLIALFENVKSEAQSQIKERLLYI
ncbi:unnamed protein product [Paramecium octaurelia]|uniref:Uncharacterized protein n=1 Tax=Paramecium octaurelia TaxID=43137 RepID=A0A8S1V8D3_PAROT|nr:unnamed protein product [Paramecium octaurelia]